MSAHRLFLAGMTSSGNEANLRDMVEPIIEHFNGGLCWTFHHPLDDGASYLESRKGAGKIVYANWANRHGYSMTHFLWQGTMQPGDFFVVLDSMERLSPAFCRDRLPLLIDLMRETNTAMIANYGKGLLFRYNEQLEFRGSPHWYATQLDGTAINMELGKDEFWNVRDLQRSEFQWVEHYARYMVSYPAGSNHALLGLEKQGDPQVLFPIRESRRLAFRQLMRDRGFPLTTDGLTQMLAGPLDATLKDFLNSEKVWNDYHRYVIQRDKTVVHSHLPSDMKLIP